MISAIIAAELASVCFLIVIVFGILGPKTKLTPSAKFFLISVLATIVGSLFDVLGYSLEGVKGIDPLLFIINLFAIVGCDFVFMPFIYYAKNLVNEKEPVTNFHANILASCLFIDFLFNLVTALTGDMFTVKDGVFMPGPLYDYNGVFQLVLLIYFLVLMIKHRKALGIKALLTIATYLIFPTVTVIAEWIYGDGSFVYVAIALVMMVVYVSLQAGEIEKGKMREKDILTISNTDSLTGLNNRRSYENKLISIPADIPLGAIFCDINGLKATNDTHGHASGDALILRFSGILKEFFPSDEMFRISGDEFVILRCGVTKEEFDNNVCDLRSKLKEAGKIASVGCFYGKGSAALSLISEAEKDMYDDKKDYYQCKGIDRRR